MPKNEGRAPTKVFFSLDELKAVKMAALSLGLTASEFARQATLKAAAAELADFVPPTLQVSQPAVRKKKS